MPLGSAGGPGETLRAVVAAQALSPETDPALLASLALLEQAGGASIEAVLFFGSRRTGAAGANAFSAYDLFVLVGEYRPFYEALRRSGLSGKSPRLLSLVSRWLPPTQISLHFAGPGLHAKASVMRLGTFRRETSRRRRDHFSIGRLFQPARLLLAREAAGEDAGAEVLDGLVSARRETWRWVRPWLPEAFDADAYGRRTLEVSMGWEVRPEPPGRAAALWSAQRDAQLPAWEALLVELQQAGELQVEDGPGAAASYSLTRRPGALEAFGTRLYFSVSIVRSTLRWAKHVVSFDGWLEYIVRKASRHTGETIELRPHERRWPLVFLWGRVFRYLRAKNRRGNPR
jgi:hypothetical protein